MNSELRDRIHQELNLRETDDLLEIWQTNDRVEWSDIAFDVLAEILEQRLGAVAPQDEPIIEHHDEPEELEGFEDWETKLLDSEDQPEFYDTIEVLDVHHTLNKIAKASVYLYTIICVLRLPVVNMLSNKQIPSSMEIVASLPNTFILILGYGLQIAFTYYGLKALDHILRILMEMEFNSRKAKP